MTWWDDKAVRWQERNRIGEANYPKEFTEQEAMRAAVHTREDVTMLVALLSALNRQASTIKWLLVVLAVLVAYIAIRVSGRF